MAEGRTQSFPGRYSEIKHICDFVGDAAGQVGFDQDAVFQVQLACDEACTNVIEHTYKGEDGGKLIVGWALSKQDFVITIRDEGDRFDAENIPPPPAFLLDDAQDANNDQIQVGGLGVHFMRNLMDEVAFSYQDGGNVLVMKKRLPPEEES